LSCQLPKMTKKKLKVQSSLARQTSSIKMTTASGSYRKLVASDFQQPETTVRPQLNLPKFSPTKK
jgi:hypothetical protein